MKKSVTCFLLVIIFNTPFSFAFEITDNTNYKNNILVDPPCETYIYGPTSWCINAGGISLSGSVNEFCEGYWNIESGSGTLSGGGLSLLYYPSPADAGTTVRITLDNDGLYCAGGITHAFIDIAIYALPGAAGVISGLNSVCQGQTGVVYSVPSIANATGYSWSLPTGASIVSGSNTNSITINLSTSASSGNISVLGTNSCGNGTAAIFPLIVNPLPGTAGTITGSTNVCQGQNGVTYTVASISNATGYTWTLPSGASILSGNNTNNITVNFAAAAVGGNVGVTGTNSCGSGVPNLLAIAVNPLPLPSGSITGTNMLCAGTSGLVYSVAAITNATGYNWILPSGASITNGNNTNTITVSYSASASSGNILVNGVNSCGNGAVSILGITVNPLPAGAGSVSGFTSVCQGQNGVTYSVPTILNATGYNWTLPTGATIVSGNNTNTLAVNYSSVASSGNISVVGTNGCGNGTVSVSLPVSVNPLPGTAGTISGSTSVCQGQNGITYAVATISNTTGYTWTLPPGASIVSGNNTNSITVNFSSSATAGGVGVTGINSCGSGTTSLVPVSVSLLPVTAGSIIGTTTICAGSTNVIYSVAAIPNATGYTWILPSGASITNGNNTNSITVNFSTNALSGNILVNGVNSCGNGASSTLGITVNPLPSGAGSISGFTSVCQGQNGVTYSVPTILNATGYNWNLPAGASIVSGTPSNSITVDFSASASSGTITVTGVNSCGSGISSSSFSVNVNPLPLAAGSISGTATVCKGQNGVSYSVPAIANSTDYIWNLPSGASVSSGNNTHTIIVNFSANALSGDITVYGTNTCGSGGASLAFSVNANDLPVVTSSVSASSVCAGSPVILWGSGAVSYTWTGGIMDGIAFTPGSTNTYTVTGTDGNGCSNTSTTTINVFTPATPIICMVTVDSTSNNNIVYWDKSAYLNTGVDSFIVYRETISNIYNKVGAVSIDSLSLFTDTVRALYFPFTGNPNVGTYRYKLQIRDTCGNLSPMSLYHNTIYANQTGGTFNWNHYQIEGEPTPIPQLSAYILERDNNNTGIWQLIGGVAGTQTSVTDQNYASFPNARWRIETTWSISCDPTRATINTTRSNIKGAAVSTGLTTNELNNSILLYPNPASNEITIEISEHQQEAIVRIANTIGQIVYEETIYPSNNAKTLKHINTSNYSKGIYSVSIVNKGARSVKKLVIN